MRDMRKFFRIAGPLAFIGLAIYTVVALDAQAPVAGDFSSAGVAEVRDGQGQVVLRGQFSVVDDEGDDIERKATLEAVGSDPDAAGDAEVESSHGSTPEQEIEFSIRNVEPGGVYTFVIDGRDVGTATADRQGRVEFEVEVTNPNRTLSR